MPVGVDADDRVGERVALSMFISGLHEQLETGKLLAADAAAACRMLDEGGFQRFKVSAGKRKAGASNAIPNLEGYPRAVTR